MEWLILIAGIVLIVLGFKSKDKPDWQERADVMLAVGIALVGVVVLVWLISLFFFAVFVGGLRG